MTDDTDWTNEAADELPASVVRPYTVTSGRTTGRIDVPLEATIELTDAGRRQQWPSHDPRGQIAQLCASNLLSVAEIAARCGLAIGVARVLIGDLAADDLVVVQQTLDDRTSSDERFSLMERTLRGLRDL